MELKLSVSRSRGLADVVVSLDPGVAVGVLAERIVAVDPDADPVPAGHEAQLTLAVRAADGWVTIPPSAQVHESGLRSGATTAVVPLDGAPAVAADDSVVAVLEVLAGPDTGREFPLRAGTWTIGRGPAADLQLTDPLVSRRHAVLRVRRDVRVIDHNSANGTQVDGLTVASARLTEPSRLGVGDTGMRIRVLRREEADGPAHGNPVVAFNRSPFVEPEFTPLDEEIADPPQRPDSQPFPFLSVLLSLAMGLLFWLVTRNALTAIFFGFSSLLLVGTVLEQGLFGRRRHARARATYRDALDAQQERFRTARDAEERARRTEHPSVADARTAIVECSPLLWTRRPDQERFGQVRLGTARQRSRSRLAEPEQRGDPDLLAEANAAAAAYGDVDDVPVPAALQEVGALGVCGPHRARGDGARGLVTQLVALHSPEDLAVAAVVSADAADGWAWLRWLPHCALPGHAGVPLAADADAGARLVSALEELVLARHRRDDPGATTGGDRRERPRLNAAGRAGPLVVVVVEDGAPVERGRLVELAEQGGAVGVHLLWCAATTVALPAACRAYLELHADGGAAVGRADAGEVVNGVRTEGVPVDVAEALARLLAPVVDAGAAIDRQADLPRVASFVEHVGREVVREPDAILDRWRETDRPADLTSTPRTPSTLRALVGQGAGAPFHLDLREHGPHALVGGTTGAGKSEFVQSWLLGMAIDHSPTRVTFLLVDYKGGAAFHDIVRLPHTVGLVTDLTPRLVRRALSSLRAEVRHRERILAAAGAPDLLELERRGDPSAPPALVIVVDEFAALVQEVPQFVDGVIDIAQRGRSLGLHLILATQRPAGVIRDNLRANTNLRVALRMADAEDSIDVLGTRDAALFDPAVPGRAMAKTGPGRVTPFQALYAGGRTSAVAPPPDIDIVTLRCGPGEQWRPHHERDGVGDPHAAGAGPTDVRRLVDTIRKCAHAAGLAAPRRPWLPELPTVVELDRLCAGVADDGELVLGLGDDPHRQRQTAIAYRPDDDGTLVVLGTSASGKSAALRSVAVAAGLAAAGAARAADAADGRGPCHVYGLDFGSRGLTSLEHLPHVGSIVVGDDTERVTRLLDWLRVLVDERAERYARVSAGSIAEYRRRAGRPEEPRILLLLDNVGGFRSAYEMSRRDSRLYDMLPGLALDGRAVGVHLVVSAARPTVVPPGLASTAKKRLALRLVDDTDLAVVGLRQDAFGPDTPPGRGYLDGLEVQVAVLGDEPDVAHQVDRMRCLAAQMPTDRVGCAPPIRRLAETVDLSALPPETAGLPTLGIAGDTLETLGLDPTGTFLVAGPPQSGRTTALLTVAHAVQRCQPRRQLFYMGTHRSPLVGSAGPTWVRVALDADEVGQVARELTQLAASGDGGHDLGVVIEDVPAFADTAAQEPLEQMIAAFAAAGHLVVGDGETSALTSSWGLPRAMKAGRHGLVLQPDTEDGDSVLRTAFPRVARADFPPGRGLYVRSGRVRTIQVALPT